MEKRRASLPLEVVIEIRTLPNHQRVILFLPSLNKFLTKGSGLESSSGGGATESQRTSYEQFLQKRFSDVTNMHPLPSNSPAVPLRIQDRKIIKPIIAPMMNSTQDENLLRYTKFTLSSLKFWIYY